MKGRAKIIVADGIIAHLEKAVGFLKDEYEVRAVTTCAELNGLAGNFEPDLIIAAASLPGKDSEALVPLLKSLFGKDIPLIILINDALSTVEDMHSLSEADDLLLKPFSGTLIKKRIGVHLLLKHQQEEMRSCRLRVKELVAQKTKTVLDLQNALVRCLTDAMEHRGEEDEYKAGLTQKLLKIMLDGMHNTHTYTEEIVAWDIPLFMLASYLHDVGKVAIPDHILLKPQQLSPEEFELIAKHTEYGEEMIQKMESIIGAQEFITHAKTIIATHHEKWDGSGYPKGLSGENIPLQGRLMAIIDVYEALVSRRPYKPALSHEEAVEIIDAGRGGHFDAKLVDVFMHMSGNIGEMTTQA